MKKLAIPISVCLFLCAAISMHRESVVYGQDTKPSKPLDVRTYLENNHVISLYREWINRGQPEVTWSDAKASTAGQEPETAWKQIKKAVRAIRQIKEDEIEILVKAICLACRSAMSSSDMAAQCRASEEIQHLCVEIQKRLIEHPNQYAGVPINDVIAVTALTDMRIDDEHVTRFERRMAEDRKAAEAAALSKREVQATSSPSSMPSEQGYGTDSEKNRVVDNGDSVDACVHNTKTSIESLFARAVVAMGMSRSEKLDDVAIRLHTELPLPKGKHNEAILLARLTTARASVISLATVWEMCRTTGSVPANKTGFVAMGKQMRASIRKHATEYPDLCMSPERLWRFSQQSIAMSQKSLRTPSAASAPTSSERH